MSWDTSYTDHTDHAEPASEPTDTPAPNEATDGSEAAKPVKKKSSKKAATKAPSETDIRRYARHAITTYLALADASDDVVQVVSVLAEATGRARNDIELLAVQLVAVGKPDDTDRLLRQAIDEVDKTERLVAIVKCTAAERSRMWRVLTAMNAITGSPSPTDEIGTAMRMATAIEELTPETEQLLTQAVEILKAR